MSRDLSHAASNAQTLQNALTAGDTSTISSSLAELRSDTGDAHARTDGVTWSILTNLPFLGDDAHGVQVVSQVLNDLSGSGLGPLATQAANLSDLLPRNGQIPLNNLQQLGGPVASADQSFAEANLRLSEEDSTRFVGPLKVRYDDLTLKVSEASKALAEADTALKIMPGMLGAGGPRNYLLVFQNNAEIRATGGLPGAVVLLHADDGRLTIVKQASGASFGESKRSALPLSQAERRVYGSQLGRYFLDANFTPDFPRAAALWKAHWVQHYGGSIDGVVSLDPVALSYILKATGPVTADGSTLSSENVVDELLHNTYLRFPEADAQDSHFQAVASAVFAKVSSGTGGARPLLEALSNAVQQRRLLLYSFDQEEERVLDRTQLAGALPRDATPNPTAAVTLDDTTGSKMSFYLRYQASATSVSCRSDQQQFSGGVDLQSLAPRDSATALPPSITGDGVYGIPVGSQLVTVRVYSPVGGRITGAALNKKQIKAPQVDALNGRDVLTAYVLLGPQKTGALTWTMVSGAGQTLETRLNITPSIAGDAASSVDVPSSCR